MKKNKFVILLIVILIPLAISFCLSYWVIKNEEIFWPNYVKIEKIEPTISWPTMSESDNTILEGDKITLSNNGSAYVDENDETQSVDGVFSIEDTTKLKYEDGVLVSSDLEKSVSFTIKTTFTPNDTSKYSIVQKSDTIYMLPVARIGSNYYGTIKKALDSGASDNNSNTIYVIVGSEKGGRSPFIRSNVTIAQNDKLIIPFNDNGTYENREGSKNFFADSSEPNIEIYRKNIVTTLDNVNITISKDAELIIGGTLGSETQGLQGHTSGDYCQLTLGSNSKILNSGTLNVLGYIKETNKTANSQIENLYGSYMILPMVIYDYRGGQSTAGVFENKQGYKIFPFNVYDFPNVQSKVTTNYGAKVDAYVDMFTGYIEKSINVPLVGDVLCKINPRHNLTTVNFISSSNALINLSNGSKLIHKYTPYYTNNTPLTVSDQTNGTTSIIIDGSGSFGTIQLSIKAADSVVIEADILQSVIENTVKPTLRNLLNRDLTTEGIYFPISWKYSIVLKNGDFNLDNYVKLLTGSTLTIDSSSVLIVKGNAKLAIYDSYNDGYPTQSLRYPEKDSAKLINNGKLTVDGAIGGTILNSSTNAILELNSSDLFINDCREGWASMGSVSDALSNVANAFNFTESNTVDDGNGNMVTRTINTKGYIDDSTEFLNFDTAFYKSTNRNNDLIKNYGYWSTSGDYSILEISFVADGINETLNIKKVVAEPNQDKTGYFYIINEENLPKPTKDHYTFDGWYTDQTFNSSADGIEINSNITLYAKFDEMTYTVNYAIEWDDCTSINLVNNNIKEFNISNPINLTLPTDGNLKFDGWYKDDAYTTKIEEITVNDVSTGNEITIYGKFTNKKQYTVSFEPILESGTFENDEKTNYIFTNKNPYEDEKISKFIPPSDTIDNNILLKYYLEGWYIDEELTIKISQDKQIKEYDSDNDLKVTLYSKWKLKTSVTVKKSNGQNNPTGTLKIGNESLDFKGGTEIVAWAKPGTKGSYQVTGDTTDGEPTISDTNNTANLSYTSFDIGTYNITINVKGTDGCIVSGTFITLADGSKKKIDDITYDDYILVFNHETGKWDVSKMLFITHEDEGFKEYETITLKFSNDYSITIVAEHGFYDMDLMRYVFISKENVESFVGHRFYSTEFINGEFIVDYIELTSYEIKTEMTRIFCPVTAYHMNSFNNGLLAMPNFPYGAEGLVNIFEYDDDLKFNEEKMKADIEKYGIFEYEYFKDYFSYEAYLASPAVYLKVSIGKGYLTHEQMMLVIEYLLTGDLIE